MSEAADGPKGWNPEVIRRHLRDCPETRALVEALAQRERAPKRGETLLDEAVEMGLRRSQGLDFFKALESARCGRVILGRRGQPTRFAWTENAVAVAREVLSERAVAAGDSDAREDSGSPVSSSELREHVFVLRAGLSVHVTLPLNLNQREAARLASWIETLVL